MSDPIALLPLAQLRADDDFQPRSGGLSEAHVRVCCESDPASWPPLLVTPNEAGGYDLIDGFHRFEAANRLGLQALPCRIDPAADYFTAVAANITHGLPLSLADRKAAAVWLAEQEPDLSYRELGRRVGLSDKTVKRALTEEPSAENPHAKTSPIRTLVRQVERTYRAGEGRTWLGFGRDGDAKAFRREIDAYDPDDQPDVARALLAFGHACVAAAQPYLTEEA
jgi:hypothetical protein